jgi:hypothetical protein
VCRRSMPPRGSPPGGRTPSRSEDAERFIEKVRGDYSELAIYLRTEEREFEAGGLN